MYQGLQCALLSLRLTFIVKYLLTIGMVALSQTSLSSYFITARIRRMGKVMFSVCVSVHTRRGGTPSSWWWRGTLSSWWWGVPHPADGRGGYPIQLVVGGTPAWTWMGGYLGYPLAGGPHPGYPLAGGPTWGTPQQGEPHLWYPLAGGPTQGTPAGGPTWGTIPPGRGSPTWGTPHRGTPPGVPPPPPPTSTACTCYTVGGMPLAFTQEDFLVNNLLSIIWTIGCSRFCILSDILDELAEFNYKERVLTTLASSLLKTRDSLTIDSLV